MTIANRLSYFLGSLLTSVTHKERSMKSKFYKNPTKVLGIVNIVDPQGHTMSRESIWSDSPRIYGILKNEWGVDKSGDISIPVEFAKSKRAFVKPQMCLYDATSKYLTNLFGIHLDWPDEDFFGEHPLTSPMGVSEDNTLRVVNDLIAETPKP